MSVAENPESTLFVLIGVVAALYTYVTIQAIVTWRRFRLRTMLMFAVTFWITFPYLLFTFWDSSIYQFVYIACSLAATAIFIRFLRVDEARENSVAQLIKRLPLKNRLLCMYPKDLLAEGLPPPTPPAPPWPAQRVGMLLLLTAGLLNIIMGVPRLFSSSSLGEPLDLLEMAFLGSPAQQVLCGAFLLIATVLVFKKFLAVGGLIGLGVGILVLLNGLFNAPGGLIGVAGGVLSLADRREQKRTNVPKGPENQPIEHPLRSAS